MLPAVPPDIVIQILPSQDLTILGFLKFPLPIIQQESPQHQIQPQEFFLTLNPTTTDANTICATPVPPLPLLKQLESTIDLQQVNSILCPHLPSLLGTQLPTWVLSFWIEAAHIWPVKKEWISAEESLDAWKRNKKWTDHTMSLVNHVFDTFACLSWTDKVKGFLAILSMDILTTYTTKDWLKDEHENQMLYLLECQLARTQNDEGVHIGNTFFITKLLEIYQ